MPSGEVGRDVSVEPAEALDLFGAQPARVLAGSPEQALELVPARPMGDNELVEDGHWTTPTR